MHIVVDGGAKNNRTFKARPSARPTRSSSADLTPTARRPASNGATRAPSKFQGSEAAAVIVAIPPGTVKIIANEPCRFDKSAVYTAFSRAKEHLSVVVGPDELIKVGCHDRRRRVTALPGLIREGVRQEAVHG
jgi:hypothetical protein